MFLARAGCSGSAAGTSGRRWLRQSSPAQIAEHRTLYSALQSPDFGGRSSRIGSACERKPGLIDGALTALQRRQNLVAVIAAMAVTALIYGLSLPLLSLVMDAHGVHPTLIGLSTAVQAIGIVLMAPFLPAYMSRSGPAVLMLGAILVSLVAFLLLPVFTSIGSWFVLRFVIGAAGGVLVDQPLRPRHVTGTKPHLGRAHVGLERIPTALGGLAELVQLDLTGTQVTDAGLAHLRGLVGLVQLELVGTAVGNQSHRRRGLVWRQARAPRPAMRLGPEGVDVAQGDLGPPTIDRGPPNAKPPRRNRLLQPPANVAHAPKAQRFLAIGRKTSRIATLPS